jgi:hypothetical protein
MLHSGKANVTCSEANGESEQMATRGKCCKNKKAKKFGKFCSLEVLNRLCLLGNEVVNGNLNVGGTTSVGNLSVAGTGSFGGPVTIGGCTLVCTSSGLSVSTSGGSTTITGAGAISPFSMFYGLTSGTGNGGATDYAATIPVKTSAGTGRVPFPRSGPTTGVAATNIDGSSFNLPNIGTYEVTFRVHTTEPGQLELELNGADLADTVAVNMNPTSGGHPIIGNAYITTTFINSVLAVINPDGNSTALTITPANGAETHANTQSITIRQIA